MQRALLKQGVAAGFLARDLCIDFKGDQVQDDFFDYKPLGLFKRLYRKLRRIFGARPSLTQQLQELRPKLECEFISSPESTYQLQQHRLVQEADIIHLHWINGIVDYQSFFLHLDKPVFWTLHDMNPFLGMFHYAADQQRNSALAGKLEQQIIQQKKLAYAHLNNLTLLSPSAWLLKAAKNSAVFPQHTVCAELANGIDFEVYDRQFKSHQREASKRLKLLYVSDRIANPRKGADLLKEALESLSIPVELFIMGSGQLQISNPQVEVVSLGFINNDSQRIAYTCAADALLLPSREDNLPNTMLESLACGTPVISFNTGGMAQYIESGKNGLLVDVISSKALARGIAKFHEIKDGFDRREIQLLAKDNFDANNQAKKLLNRYLDTRYKTPKP